MLLKNDARPRTLLNCLLLLRFASFNFPSSFQASPSFLARATQGEDIPITLFDFVWDVGEFLKENFMCFHEKPCK